jgi:hypothetical protein
MKCDSCGDEFDDKGKLCPKCAQFKRKLRLILIVGLLVPVGLIALHFLLPKTSGKPLITNPTGQYPHYP